MGLLDIISSITSSIQKGVNAVDNINSTVSSARNTVSNTKTQVTDIKEAVTPVQSQAPAPTLDETTVLETTPAQPTL